MTGSRVKSFRWLMGSVVLLTATAFGSMKLAAQSELPKVQAIAAQPAVVQVVTAANTTQANWTKAQITQYGRDWRKQFAANQGALLAAVKNNPATQALTQAQQNSAGLYNELTLFSQQGVIVADTQVGKQYRNASKVLWNQAFLANGSYVSGVKNDRQLNQKTISIAVPVLNSAQQPIGVLVAVLNTAQLPAMQKARSTKSSEQTQQ